MKKRKYTWIWVVLSLAWIILIFWHSSKSAAESSSESLRLLYYVKKLLPFMTDHLLRKLAHFVEYTILGIFLTGSFYGLRNFILLKPLSCGLLVALCDETFQLSVVGRSGSLKDVWLDLSGVVVGTLVLYLFFRLRRK